MQCRIDRLSHVQRMLLKVAAVVGDEFNYDPVEQSYPLALEPGQSLMQALQNLVELNIIKMVQSLCVHIC